MADGERFGAFISYSRGVSSQLAADLQTGIERFAKPWNQLRAVRVFRDDSSMSANPALWSAIEAGLTESQWLVLLATPEAAASEYVNKEVAWWVEHKSADRILLVRASGEIGWEPTGGTGTGGDFDPHKSTAIPPTLFGAYAEEPRWIDLTWFAEPESLGRADPRFNERVADLASAIRGIPRDALVGENVAQHRKSRRLTRLALSTVSALLVVAVTAGGLALAQKAEATRQRDTAESQATTATARQLATSAEQLAPTDLRRALQLAAYAYKMHQDSVTATALFKVNSADGQIAGFLDAGSEVTATGVNGDGSVVVAGTSDGKVLSWQLPDTQAKEVMRINGEVRFVGVSDDARTIVGSTAAVDPVLLSVPQSLLEGDPTSGMMQAADGSSSASPSPPPTDAAVSVDSVVTHLDHAVGALSPSGRVIAGLGWITTDAQVHATTIANDGQLSTKLVSVAQPDLGRYGDFLLPSDDTLIAYTCATGAVHNVATNSPKGGFTLDGYVGATACTGPSLSPEGEFFTAAGLRSELGVIAVPQPVIGSDPQLFASMGTSDYPLALALSPQGKRLARAADGKILVSDVGAKSTTPLVLPGAGKTTFGTMRFIGQDRLISASGSAVTLWDLSQVSRVSKSLKVDVPSVYSACSGACRAVAVSPNGAKIVTFNKQETMSGEMLVADVARGVSRVIGEFGDDGIEPNFMQATQNHLTPSAAIWLDDERLAVYSQQESALWVLSGPLLETIERRVSLPAREAELYETASLAHHDGHVLVASAGQILDVGLAEKSVVGSSAYPGGAFSPSGTFTTDIAASPDTSGEQATKVTVYDVNKKSIVSESWLQGFVVQAENTQEGLYSFRSDSSTNGGSQLDVSLRSPETGVDVRMGQLPTRTSYVVLGSQRQAAVDVSGKVTVMHLDTRSSVEVAEVGAGSKQSNSLGFSTNGDVLGVVDATANEVSAIVVSSPALLSLACETAAGDITDGDWITTTGMPASSRPRCV